MEKEDSYLTIADPAEGIYKEKGSKFFGYAYPVHTEGAINPIIAALKKEHHNARHVCFAWVLGAGRSLRRANDANEPKNTAGKPILGQIDAHNLTNVLVAVVRYFGGTKLGTSGLVNAYKTTAASALQNAKHIEKSISEHYEVVFEHHVMNEVMQIIKGQKLEQIEQDFGLNNKVVVAVRKNEAEKIVHLFKRIPGIKINQVKTQ